MYFAYKSKSVSNSYIFMVHVTTFNFIYHKLWFEDVIATHWWILTVFINVKFLRWRKLVRFPLTQCYISPLENSDQISIELMLTLSILVWDINWLSIHLTTIKDASLVSREHSGKRKSSRENDTTCDSFSHNNLLFL